MTPERLRIETPSDIIRFVRGLVVLAVALVAVAGAASASSTPDPPLLVPWDRVGDISLGEQQAQVEADYGSGEAFHVLQRYSGSIQGYYRLHGTRVIVTFTNHRVNEIDFVTAYYRTRSGFGIGTKIPLGPCHHTTTGCEYEWHGFVFHARWKDSPCNCWIKVGTRPQSLPVTNAFLKPWFFIFTRHSRTAEIFLSLHYTD